MFTRYRFLIVALGLTVSLLVHGVQAQEQKSEPNNPTQSAETAEEPQSPNIYGTPPVSIDVLNTVPAKVVQEQAEEDARDSAENERIAREKDDLLAQQGMDTSTRVIVRYTRWQTLFVFLGTLAVIGSLLLMYFANRAALKAVEVTREIGEAQTRAYISHMPNGATFPVDPRTPKNLRTPKIRAAGEESPRVFKYSEFNFGNTPAHDVEMFVCISPGLDPPTSFNGDFTKLDVIGYVAPGQEIGKIIPNDFAKKDKPFFLYGYVDYTDIFNKRYRRRFALNHDPERKNNGDDEWYWHSEHNDEIPQPTTNRPDHGSPTPAER